jgi:hypothetical protein
MIDKSYRMKDAIIAVLASQSCDDSILNFQSLIGLVPKELLDKIMQADNYPTLNRTLPEYFCLIGRLEALKDGKDKPVSQSERLLLLSA